MVGICLFRFYLIRVLDVSCTKNATNNCNDKTNEGLLYKDCPAFSVQFHPEACGGPQDTGFLFDEFIKMMSK